MVLLHIQQIRHKKLPNSVEEFRKQFKMDKKAEQAHLAEQSQ